MLYGLYLSAAGLQAEDYRQNVFANNMANSQTVGFKRSLATVMARQSAVDEDPTMAGYRVPVLSQQGGGVSAAPTRLDLSQGTMQPSSNPLDLALQGQGFFTVQDSTGQTRLTRDGRFMLNKDNQLVMQSGPKVLDDTGNPITLNPALGVTVGADGQLTQDGTKVAQLGLRNVSDPLTLQQLGDSLLTARGNTKLDPAPADTLVKQRATEASDTDPIIEMVNMLDGQRAFEANAHMITYQDQTLQQLNAMGRLA